MTRGNQRDKARAKTQKKQQEIKKKKNINNDGLTLEARKHRDAEVMREKQRKNVKLNDSQSGEAK